jgi:hypothetical protein
MSRRQRHTALTRLAPPASRTGGIARRHTYRDIPKSDGRREDAQQCVARARFQQRGDPKVGTGPAGYTSGVEDPQTTLRCG